MADEQILRVIRPGEQKPRPFTIVIIANPALEAPRNSGQFIADPITRDQTAFDAASRYIEDALFGRLPDQAERFLGEPSIASRIRLVSLFVPGLPLDDRSSLVAQDDVSRLLVARRSVFVPFLSRYGLEADVVYAISKSETHRRASAWYTSDDDAGPGASFTLDGVTLSHRHYPLIPGTIAQHAGSESLTALHEFGHALSSYSNGRAVDLYVDSPAGLNNRRARPIPATFATYDGTAFATDAGRGGIGYPDGWQSYHCELHDPRYPAIMDDYWKARDGIPERCQHDRITRRFLLDRVRAKLAR